MVSDPLLFLAANNPGDTEDIGLVANYNPGGGNLHTGFARDYTDGTWKLFQGVTSDPNTVIAWNEAVYAPFKAGSILSNATITANANVVATGNVSGTYLLGNGYFVSGIQYSNITGTYGNSNVADYLPTYTGNLVSLTGNIITTGNITGGNLSGTLVSGTLTTAAQPNITSVGTLSSLAVTGNVTSASGNISGNYLLGNGAFISGLPAGYSNADVANYLASNAAVTILTTGNITTSANISAGNVVGTGTNTTITTNGYTWTFDNTGNLTAPGNVSATANVIANYFIGNGALLTGIAAGYSNANVANYLPTYTGNILAGNLEVTQDAVILGNFRVQGNTTYINVSDLIVEDKDIIVGANASATLSDLNGAGLQIGNISAGGNITFFYNSISNTMVLSHGANIANTVGVTGNIDASGNISGLYLLGNGSQLTGISAGAVIADDTTTNSNYYPVFATATSGSLTTATISSTKLTFNPGSGTLTAVDVNTSSDAKFKENVQQIASAVDTINSIQGVSFNWKETGQRSYGIIAQELAEVLPELVHSAERGLTVSYLPLIAILIEAIKEQQQQIDQLKNTKPS